ncbi:sigma-54-dependent Fis family transcriptional regulator [Paracoccus sp. IB05]|uniref:sigma-54-dependent Fis family transcriptional regulator n=1 Tax=Paracoccus sp. IB05 TaxID=2779367 RepID=UPI0018E79BA7|nr:sigma 54-interacting transcriptional regulator [Paracoccus sp. IB05]MBJ2151795.1 sigma-54-dependent Fis family transcriptional regulator [Paracoccus sp. IB05]
MEMQTSALTRARHQLETQGRFPGGALPGDITESWLRSLDHGLDPLERSRRLIQSSTEFTATCQLHADLIRFARPELELLFDQIAGSNFMIALGSPEGVVLDTMHDPQFAETEAGAQVIPGSVWSEDLRGTNAMGVCIATGRPAQVYGGEHFLRAHGDVSCISAPIFDGAGQLAGVLDASSMSAVRQQHTAALVQMSASSIENSLIRVRHDRSIVLQFHPRPEYLGTLSMGMLVLGEDLTVTAINRKGEMFLTGFPRLMGESFDRIFEQPFAAIQRRLAEGETLRIRDRIGSAVSLRAVANRASFALARRLRPVADEAAPAKNLFRDVVVEDPALWQRLQALPDAARRGVVIAISGETGTGKALIARLAHAAMARPGPLVVLDGRMLAEADLPQLLGAEGQPGLLQQTEGGTLLLDEVTALPQMAQAALAGVLDSGEYRQPATGALIRCDLRVVSVTSEAGGLAGLLPALRYRLEGFRLELPPLRKRADLAALALRFARSVRAEARISETALARLAAHDWPGNLHELRATVIQAMLGSTDGVLEVTDFDALLPQPAAVPVADCCSQCTGVPWKESQCQAIRTAVQRHEGNVSLAARALGMSRTTIYKHLGDEP